VTTDEITPAFPSASPNVGTRGKGSYHVLGRHLTCMGLDVSGFIRFDTVPERATDTGGAVYGGGGAPGGELVQSLAH